MSPYRSFILCASLACGAVVLGGCGTGQDRKADTAQSSAQVAVDVTKAKQDLDGTLADLKNLRDASDSADLKKLQAGLAARTSQLDDSLAGAVASGEAAVVAGKAQNDAWHQQADAFTDADLRNASQKRQGDLRGAVDGLAGANAALKTQREAYVSQLKQTASALDLDLTQQGMQAIKPILGKLIDGEPTMRQALSDVAARGRAVNTVINP
jgi:hypothetical protein